MERIAGAMLGLGCGDALGAPIEYMDPITVRRRYGRVTDMMAGGQWQAGEGTDDTAMTLCVAEGILASPDDPVPAVGSRLLSWSDSAKDIDSTVSAVLVSFRSTGDWLRAARGAAQSDAPPTPGNGALKRVLPVALAYSDLDRMLRESARLTALTHRHPEAEACSALYCLWIREILAGGEPRAAWAAAVAIAQRVASDGPRAPDSTGFGGLAHEFWERFETVTDKRYEDLQSSGYAGHCAECLEAAAWCCVEAEGGEQAILDAINLAGVADTIGALAGGAAGACWGAGALPERWLAKLRQRERLEDVARRLETLRREATPASP